MIENKRTDIKKRAYYYFDNIININDIDPENINVTKRPYKDMLIYVNGYKTSKGIKPLTVYYC